MRLRLFLCRLFGHPGWVSQSQTFIGERGRWIAWTRPVCARCRMEPGR